jgi:hypothetical protein
MPRLSHSSLLEVQKSRTLLRHIILHWGPQLSHLHSDSNTQFFNPKFYLGSNHIPLALSTVEAAITFLKRLYHKIYYWQLGYNTRINMLLQYLKQFCSLNSSLIKNVLDWQQFFFTFSSPQLEMSVSRPAILINVLVRCSYISKSLEQNNTRANYSYLSNPAQFVSQYHPYPLSYIIS